MLQFNKPEVTGSISVVWLLSEPGSDPEKSNLHLQQPFQHAELFFPYLGTEIIYSAFRKLGTVCKKHGFLNRLISISPFFCLISANLLLVIQLSKKDPVKNTLLAH